MAGVRVDVSKGTLQTYRVALGRLIPRLGDTLGEIDAQTVAALVAELHASKLRKQTIRKTVRRHVEPSNAKHVEDVVRLLPARYRLLALVLDATGMRVGEPERLTWGDVDEPQGRWRVSAAVAKTGRPRWVQANARRRRRARARLLGTARLNPRCGRGNCYAGGGGASSASCSRMSRISSRSR